ncbi:MAG: MFS transporter, partial [Geodermatophilaceae bacterium]
MTEPHVGHERRWAILGVLTVCLVVVIMGNTILNVALRRIQEDLQATQGELQWAVDAYILVFAGLLFTWGVLGDRFGRRLVLVGGLAIFTIASIFAAYADTALELIVWRALMGVGGAAVQPATLAVITNIFPTGERAKAIGVWAGTSGLAIAVGPMAGGFLLEHFWWGSVFLLNVPIAIAGLVLSLWLVPESRDPHPGRIDVGGVLLSIAALGLLVFGLIRGGEGDGWLRLTVLGPALGGLLLLALFIYTQRRSTSPALDVTLFGNPSFSSAAAALGLVFFALLGATFFLVFYLQGVREYSPLQSGAVLLPVAIAIAIFAPRSSTLVVRYGAKAVTTVGMLVIAASFGGFVFLQESTPLWILLVLLFVQGVGMGNTMAPATESIMSVVPRDKAGAGSAVNNSVRQVGGALGVAILGSLLNSLYSSRVTPALSGLSAQQADTASESLVGALSMAESKAAEVAELSAGVADGSAQAADLARAEDQLRQLGAVVDPAKDAFVSAMHVTSIATCVVVLVAALIVAVWLPGRQVNHESPTQRRKLLGDQEYDSRWMAGHESGTSDPDLPGEVVV